MLDTLWNKMYINKTRPSEIETTRSFKMYKIFKKNKSEH